MYPREYRRVYMLTFDYGAKHNELGAIISQTELQMSHCVILFWHFEQWPCETLNGATRPNTQDLKN